MPRTIDRELRKAQLAEAVWQVIVDRGISAVSIRSVAEVAGVVVGSLRHVFPTRAELLTFSAELMVQRATERVRAVDRGGNPRAYALEVLKQLIPLDRQRRAEMEVNVALIAESTSEPALIPIRDHAHRALFEGCVRLVERLTDDPGGKHVQRTARRLHALVDGLATHLLHQPADASTDWAVAILRHELAGIESRSRARIRSGTDRG